MIARFQIRDASVTELVGRFQAIALAQHDASLNYQIARYNRLYDRMTEIEDELRSREGDQRRALVPLLASSNVHVRLKSALTTLAVLPTLARKALESVRDFGELPEAADASSMLRSLDDGTYVPD
jgi:hypothetical protein